MHMSHVYLAQRSYYHVYLAQLKHKMIAYDSATRYFNKITVVQEPEQHWNSEVCVRNSGVCEERSGWTRNRAGCHGIGCIGSVNANLCSHMPFPSFSDVSM